MLTYFVVSFKREIGHISLKRLRESVKSPVVEAGDNARGAGFLGTSRDLTVNSSLWSGSAETPGARMGFAVLRLVC